jgi:hypothetical protein
MRHGTFPRAAGAYRTYSPDHAVLLHQQLRVFLRTSRPSPPHASHFLPPSQPVYSGLILRPQIFHPNIDKLGRICLDILKDKWSPALQIRHVLLSIQALMSTPNPDDPLANDIAEIWRSNLGKAHETAKEWTAKYAAR